MKIQKILSLVKWTVLLLLGTTLFLFLSQTILVVGSLSNNLWGKAGLLLLGGMAVLGLLLFGYGFSKGGKPQN